MLPRGLRAAIDTLLIAASIAVTAYYLLDFGRLTTRMENVAPVLPVDIIAGIALVLLLLEGARRAVGMILVWVLLAFILYGFWGNLLPGWLYFSGFSLDAAIEITTMTTAGVLGITTSTSVSFIFYFIMFGAFYAAVGGGQLFIDLAIRAAGRATGGTAKAAIIGSSLMGSISGSAVANVVSTGVFTIPLMKRTGIPGHRAAGIEAIASTGGQLMPPVMGVAAFVMAEMLGIPYVKLALAGLIPAVAFYLALLLVVDLAARRDGVRAMTAEEVADADPILPRLHLILPPIVLIAMLVSGYSAAYAAVLASVACLVVPFLRKNTRIGRKELIEALREAPRQAAEVAVPIASIGLVIAVAIQSNLALKFAGSLLSLSDGSVYASLALAMLGCIVMGMGLPTVAAYIIGAVLFVPAMQNLGIQPLAAHFFIFYYCVLSMVTPPVALASFAAAAVGKASTVKTSLSAFGLSLVAFFVPFGFVFDLSAFTICAIPSRIKATHNPAAFGCADSQPTSAHRRRGSAKTLWISQLFVPPVVVSARAIWRSRTVAMRATRGAAFASTISGSRTSSKRSSTTFRRIDTPTLHDGRMHCHRRPLPWFLPGRIRIRGGAARKFASVTRFHRGSHPEST